MPIVRAGIPDDDCAGDVNSGAFSRLFFGCSDMVVVVVVVVAAAAALVW